MNDGGTADRRDLYECADDLWRAFADAVIRIRPDPTVPGIVLGIGRPVPALPWSGPAHVITAWNPGHVASQVDNEIANDRLLGELRATGCEIHAATGESPDGSWVEPSFAAVGLERDVALRFGRLFGQLAIFEIGDREVILLRCAAEM